QFVGRAVKHIMDDAGYVPADLGVKLPDDGVFRSGTRYRPRNEGVRGDAELPLLERFVAALNRDELHRLERLVQRALEGQNHNSKEQA
ncbi:MAG: hypothetical protein ACREFO_11355, partial [Acetobacteraceae bacterium]